MMKTTIAQALLVLWIHLHSASAGPTGASACPAGVAAVGGAHLSAEETITGALSESPAVLQVVLDGETILSVDQATSVAIGTDHTLELKRNDSPYFFKGFLFRLGSNANGTIDTTIALDLDPEAKDKEANVQVASSVCVDVEGVGGLTHVDNEDKTSVTGLLRLDQVANDLPLDVTCVIINSGGKSEYYYSRFMLNAVEGDEGEEESDEGEEITDTDGTEEGQEETTTEGGDAGSGTGAESSANRQYASISIGLLSLSFWMGAQ